MVSDYTSQTEGVLKAAARWLDDNAGALASVFSNGAMRWSVEFSWGTGDMFAPNAPEVHISADKMPKSIIDAAFGVEIDKDGAKNHTKYTLHEVER